MVKMQKPLPLQINIPNPCHENWDKMTPCQQGRFCTNCQKQVIDFTKWTDTELYKFLSKNEEPVCGRFTSYQINRPIHLLYQPHSRLYRMAIGLGLVLLFTQAPQANARIRPPFVTEQILDFPDDKNDSYEPGVISGRILNEKKQPIIGAIVEVMQGRIKKGGTVTDYDGNYLIKSVEQGRYDVRVSYPDYISTIVAGVIVSPDKTTEVNAKLKIQSNGLQETVFVAYKVPQTQRNVTNENHMIAGAISMEAVSGNNVANKNSVYQSKRINPPIKELKTVPQIPVSPKKKDEIHLDPYEPTKTIFTGEQIEKR